MKKSLLLCALVGTAAGVSAQMNLTNRSSAHTWSFLYGYAGDVRQDNGIGGSNSILDSDAVRTASFSEGSGFYPPTNNHWSARTTWDVSDWYRCVGPMTNARKILSKGLVNVTTIQTGATSTVSANTVQSLTFTTTATNTMRLIASQTEVGVSHLNGGDGFMYAWNGSSWVIYKVFIGGNTSLDQSWSMPPGQYRVDFATYGKADGNNIGMGSWAYSLEAIPAGWAQVNIDLNPLSGDYSAEGMEFEVQTINGGLGVLATERVIVDGTGKISFYTGNPGSYTLKLVPIHGTQNNTFLTKSLGIVTLPTSGSLDLSATMVNGDANADDSVDLLDYFDLSDSYNTVFGEAAYNVNADFNKDSAVDLLDYFILSDGYNQAGD